MTVYNFEKLKFQNGSEMNGAEMCTRVADDGSNYFEVKSVAENSEAWKKGVYRFWKIATINGMDPMTKCGDKNLWQQVSTGDESFTITFIVFFFLELFQKFLS